MPFLSVWDNIDKVAFCENAILLEMKSRAQGQRCRPDEDLTVDHTTLDGSFYPYSTSGLLDDLALVAAGPGGGENVTAACLEARNDSKGERHLVVRIARNAGNTEMVVRYLESILYAAAQGNCLLSTIINHCRARINKHAARLATLCHNIGLTSLPTSILPLFEANGRHGESVDDVRDLGEYSPVTHSSFVALQLGRLHDIVHIVTRKSKSSKDTCPNVELERLSQLAYSLRKSCTARQIIKQCITELRSDRMNDSTVDSVVQRLGQISRFVRAANNIEWHAHRIRDMGITIAVEDVPRRTFSIPILKKRTATDLRNRGGWRFRDFKDEGLQAMIDRWPKYREHSEIQLIMFYEENPYKIMHTTYIGCDKLSCFLCYNFIIQHGRFHTQGCHQSLYSLWTVRNCINTPDLAAAQRIQQALMYLSKSMEEKVRAQRSQKRYIKGAGTGPESVANLSRMTLVSMRRNNKHWPVRIERETSDVLTIRPKPSQELRSSVEAGNGTGVDPPAQDLVIGFQELAMSMSVPCRALSGFESPDRTVKSSLEHVAAKQRTSEQDTDHTTSLVRSDVFEARPRPFPVTPAQPSEYAKNHGLSGFREYSKDSHIKTQRRIRDLSSPRRSRLPTMRQRKRPEQAFHVRAVFDAILNILFGAEVRERMKTVKRRRRRGDVS